MERKTGIPKASGNSMKFQESAGSVVGYASYNLFHVSGITIFLTGVLLINQPLQYFSLTVTIRYSVLSSFFRQTNGAIGLFDCLVKSLHGQELG